VKKRTILLSRPQLVSDDLTLRKFIETCLAENDRRMQMFDP